MRRFCVCITLIALCLLQLGEGTALAQVEIAVSPLGTVTVLPDTLDFGEVVVGAADTLQTTVKNIGGTSVAITSYSVANSAEFSAPGAPFSYVLAPGASQVYNVRFSPASTNPAGHIGFLTITFGDGEPQKSVVLLGHDHTPITGQLDIGRWYFGVPGQNIEITQTLASSLDGALDSIRRFTEVIHYDPTILDLVSVDRGELLSSDWNILPSTLSSGQITITANSIGAALHGPGELLKFTFFVREDAPFWDTSQFVQTNVVFGSGYEPLLTTVPGLIRIRSACTPTFVNSGAVGTELRPNSPNPFHSVTQIPYTVAPGADGAQLVRLCVYDEIGTLVRTLVDERRATGQYVAMFDAHDLPTGLYSYVLDVGPVHEVRRMLFVQ